MADNENNDDQPNLEEDPMAFLPADHHLLARLQIALQKQLDDEHSRVELELVEVEDQLKKLDREKEDIGVRLYGVQQQLAENQQNFEKAHENFNFVQKLRIESEQKLKTINDLHLQKKKEVDELRKKYLKAQDELSKLTKTLHTIENYNNQMQAEIQQTRRIVYRGEENVQALEKDKKKQDYLIDQMNEEIKRLTEQKTILMDQLISQSKETENARQTMKDAQAEMEKIIASKKNLMERWQKSLVRMQRMDNALQEIREAYKKESEVNIQLGTELQGINNEIRKENARSEDLIAQKRKLENQKSNLENRRQELLEEQAKLNAQVLLLNESLKQTENETKKTDNEQRNVDEQMKLIETNIMKLHTETKSLLEDLLDSKSENTTIEKTALNLLKQAQIIQSEIEEKEIELENLNNEIARVKIDQLNTEQQIEQLKLKKAAVIKERDDKKITVATYEVQIKQGHELNEKKQHEVGRLNKVHDELTNNSSEVSRGPLEATKSNLKRQFDEMIQQCEAMHRDWIKKQTQLVEKTKEYETCSTEVDELSNKQVILENKKMRLNSQYRSHEREIREIKNSLKNLQNDMNKLNDDLERYQFKQEKLTNENNHIQSEFLEKLKELEKEAVRYEVQIDKLKDSKADLLNDIMEAEKQILLWERKIQLEKEMQEALDPNVGQSELKLLQKEIHKMELRQKEQKKSQEQIIKEMERTVFKRETIQLKYLNKDKSSSGPKELKLPPVGASNNTTQVNKQIQTLKNTLNQTLMNGQKIEQGIRAQEEQLENLQQQIQEASQQQQQMEQEAYDNKQKLYYAKNEKHLNVFKISQLQSQAKKYEELLNNPKLPFPEQQIRQKLEEQKNFTNNIKSALNKLVDEQPQLQEILAPLLDL
ncbi:unnamed protein product (macronuclear) [Paramecium tetraurelia]|uniref:Coiled-coil domain-containing protein 40 n=1 Tax=Paramecium tetraurelia TaxID=5888 RepID=A0DRM3_PARTE|nr:uncharacterized protein GSPATT00019408001 [Paramecium tetraurelia]CAK85690.1 unnamed protein product [Paramecium tetraurelia]|eukprot:XP_001453087.1 hypothetical protein (macronuclear) [Paramecium tetraurelia strain d4-2]